MLNSFLKTSLKHNSKLIVGTRALSDTIYNAMFIFLKYLSVSRKKRVQSQADNLKDWKECKRDLIAVSIFAPRQSMDMKICDAMIHIQFVPPSIFSYWRLKFAKCEISAHSSKTFSTQHFRFITIESFFSLMLQSSHETLSCSVRGCGYTHICVVPSRDFNKSQVCGAFLSLLFRFTASHEKKTLLFSNVRRGKRWGGLMMENLWLLMIMLVLCVVDSRLESVLRQHLS